VSGLPIFRISVFCSFILDPDTCPKFLNSLIRSSYSEISLLIIEQLVKDKVKVLGIWFGKDHINTNWIQIQNKVKIQFEKLKDRKLSLRISVLIIEQSSAC
jgi:hypothetical protein